MKQKIQPYKLNRSLDLKHVTPDSFIEAINVRVDESGAGGSDGSGDAGVIKNVDSNTSTTAVNDFDYVFTANKYMVLGSVNDHKTDIVYFFVWSNVLKEHGIYAYDPHGYLPKSIESGYDGVSGNHVRLIYKSSLLNFSKDAFVKADIIHSNPSEFKQYDNIRERLEKIGVWDDFSSDAIIYFTDNKNEPRKINAYRALLNNKAQNPILTSDSGYQGYSITVDEPDFICACPKAPTKKIKADFVYDPAYGASNFEKIQGMQFAYQWVYKDGIESAISVYSDIAVPPVRLTQGNAEFVDYTTSNTCRLKIPCGSREVSTIKIYVRDGDSSNFLFIDEIDRADGNQVWNIYNFRNDSVLTGVSEELVNKQFDAVPLKAQAQTVAYDRLWYGNYTSGFDNVNIDAQITPIYSNYSDDSPGNVSAHSRIRTEGIFTSAEVELDEALEINGKFNGGASFIIDASNVSQLATGQEVTFQMTVAPDKNFHIFKRHDWLPTNHSSSAFDFADNPDQYAIDDSNFNFFADTDIDGLVDVDYVYLDGQGQQVQTNSKLGSYAGSPLIIKGGEITFSISFVYNGPTITDQQARSYVSLNIAKALCGEPLPSTSQLITASVTPIHQVSLGLHEFQKINVSKPKIRPQAEVSAPDEKAFLICSIPKKDHELDQGNVGYYIVDKCKLQFRMQYIQSNGSFSEVLLTPFKITDIDVMTCIRRPNDYFWRVLSNDFFEGVASPQKFLEFKNQVQDEYDFEFGFDNFFTVRQFPVIGYDEVDFTNVLPGFYNYANQFGFIQGLNEIIFSEDNYNEISESNGVFLIDGESGIGGSNGSEYWSSISMQNMGSVPLYVDHIPYESEIVTDIPLIDWNPYTATGLSYSSYANDRLVAFGQFFTGGMSFFGVSPIQQYYLDIGGIGSPANFSLGIATINFPDSKIYAGEYDRLVNSFPLISGRVPPNYVNSEYLYENSDDYNINEEHPEIEVKSLYASVYSSVLDFFKSFKSSSYHDFGIVYYDERGRHGFVNHAGTVYVKGFSDIERTQKGRVSISVKMFSQPPSWAKSWKVVHSKSTSIDRFIQYSAGGAYVANTAIDPATSQNIYVSLNYLQGNRISYASSFGAKSPEGSPILYSFQPGDKLRVISYEDGSGNRKYDTYNYVFDVIDFKIFGDDENPISDDPAAQERHKGHFLVLKDNVSANGFSYADVLSENALWGNNAIIEIYSPSKNENAKIYYEIGDEYPINFSLDQPHGPPVTINDGDVWWRRVAVNMRESDFTDLIIDDSSDQVLNESSSNFKNIVLESETSTDLIKADSIGVGRPNVILDESVQVTNESSVIYSEPSSKSGYRIKYSSFNNSLLNFKDIDSTYGAINYMINKDGYLLCISKNKVFRLPINRNIISTAEGGYSIVSSQDIVSDPISNSYISGCDGNPESIVDNGRYVYFANKSLGKVFRSDQAGNVEDVSSSGMGAFFRDIFKTVTDLDDSEFAKINGGFDPIFDEFILSVDKYSREDATLIDSGVVYGCTDPNACNYNEDATYDDNSCTYPSACFDCDAEPIDEDGNGVCDQEEIAGCIDPLAVNFNPAATYNDGSCIYKGCMDPIALNYDPQATISDDSCAYEIGQPVCAEGQEFVNGTCTDMTIDLFIQAYGLTIGHFMALKIYGVDLTYFFSYDIDERNGWIGQQALLDLNLALGIMNINGESLAGASTYLVEPTNTDIQDAIKDKIEDYLFNIPYNEYTNIIHYLSRYEVTHLQLKESIPTLFDKLAVDNVYMPAIFNDSRLLSYDQIPDHNVIVTFQNDYANGFLPVFGQQTASLIDSSLNNQKVIP